MLLCDGHGSHFTPEAIARAAEKGVVVFCIPPNTTHVAQPLDVSFFAPLKRYWSSICHTYLAENPGCVVTKLNFSLLFSRAWVKAINPETTGILKLVVRSVVRMRMFQRSECVSWQAGRRHLGK